MELDKRIKEGKKPLDCFDAKDAKRAKHFVGKKGFFGGFKSQFMDLDTCPMCVLDELKEFDDFDGESPFLTSCKHCYRFFIPEDWVLPAEKKYRPYSLNEFLNEHEIGDKITYRTCRFKESKEQEFIRYKAMICGYQIMEGEANTPGKGFINLGGYWVSLQGMFDDYETPNSYLYPEVWQPFGVLDEEKE